MYIDVLGKLNKEFAEYKQSLEKFNQDLSLINQKELAFTIMTKSGVDMRNHLRKMFDVAFINNWILPPMIVLSGKSGEEYYYKVIPHLHKNRTDFRKFILNLINKSKDYGITVSKMVELSEIYYNSNPDIIPSEDPEHKEGVYIWEYNVETREEEICIYEIIYDSNGKSLKKEETNLKVSDSQGTPSPGIHEFENSKEFFQNDFR